jgi:hypothetical protein
MKTCCSYHFHATGTYRRRLFLETCARLAALIIAGGPVLAPLSAVSTPPAMGVLVGLMSDQSTAFEPKAPTFRTLWLAPDHGKYRVISESRELLVPRRNGFWRVGVQETCVQEPQEGGVSLNRRDYLWAAPLGRAPRVSIERAERVPPCRREPVVCAGEDRHIGIKFVWPNYISLTNTAEYGCGAHPDADVVLAVRSLDDVAGRGKTFEEIVGSRDREAFQRAFDRSKEQHLKEWASSPCEVQERDDQNWIITRFGGRWHATGRGNSHRLCGYGFDFEIDVDLPRGVVGSHGGERFFAERNGRLPGLDPDLNDVHESPDRSLFLAITEFSGSSLGHEVLLFESEATTAPTQPLLHVPLGLTESVVMVEWASGRNVERWSETLRRLQNKRLAAPEVVR